MSSSQRRPEDDGCGEPTNRGAVGEKIELVLSSLEHCGSIDHGLVDWFREDGALGVSLPRCFWTGDPVKTRVSLKLRTVCPPHVDVPPKSSRTNCARR